MSRLTALLAAFVFVVGCSSTPSISQLPADHVHYVIEPTTYENHPALQFTLTFVGRPDGRTYLEMPSKWASESDYFKDIKDLKVVTPGVTMEDGAKPYIKILTHQPSRVIEMTYVLTEQKPQGPQPFRALITADYFHFVGYAAFVCPNSAENTLLHFDIRWKKFPSSYKFANSFAADSTHLELRTNLGLLKRSIWVGGDYRLKEARIRGKPVVMAIKGAWKFTDEDFYQSTEKIVDYQRTFWKDDEFPYFLVVLTPDRAERGSVGGTSLTNSFAMSATKEMGLQESILPMLSHELFHTWNGQKLAKADPEELHYWFSEGFTDYYSRLLNLRAGVIDLKAYVKDVNSHLFEYYTSSARISPNARIQKDFWKSAEVGKLPYYRGDFLAMNWDSKIKTDSKREKSLDGFMHDLFELSKKSNPVVTDHNIIQLLNKDLATVKADLRAYIAQGNMITPDEKALGPCVKRTFISMGKFSAGYDREKTYSSGIITGLKNGTAAHKAGLREGMKYLDREMVYPPFTDSKIKVLDHGVEKWISFLPLGTKRYLMPHFVLDEKAFAKDPKACLAWF